MWKKVTCGLFYSSVFLSRTECYYLTLAKSHERPYCCMFYVYMISGSFQGGGWEWIQR